MGGAALPPRPFDAIMSAMTLTPEETRRLVRWDLAVAGVGSLMAIWTSSLLVAGSLGFIPELMADRVVAGISAIIAVGCVYWWAAGPPGMMRDRYFVLVPLFLAAGPGLYAAHALGGGLAILTIGTGVAFFGAVVLGMAVAANRHRAR